MHIGRSIIAPRSDALSNRGKLFCRKDRELLAHIHGLSEDRIPAPVLRIKPEQKGPRRALVTARWENQRWRLTSTSSRSEPVWKTLELAV